MINETLPVLAGNAARRSLTLSPPFEWWEALGQGRGRPTLGIVADMAEWSDLAFDLPPALQGAIPLLFMTGAGPAGPDIAASLAFCRMVATLPPALLRDGGAQHGLLAYMAMRHQPLVPVEDPASSKVQDYPERWRFPDIDLLAERLTDDGLLERHFHERLNDCPYCGSARLLVRDQCPSCGSADIAESVVLHHFPCAWQAPESQFRQPGGGLLCPKCRKALEHVSVDYEVSGRMIRCGACAHTSAAPVIGFRCLDCQGRGDGTKLRERQLNRYTLTAAGYALVGMEPPAPALDGPG